MRQFSDEGFVASVKEVPRRRQKTISCAVVVYNEERNIYDCLESARWMDEIIVVDAFSRTRPLKSAGSIRHESTNDLGLVTRSRRTTLAIRQRATGYSFWTRTNGSVPICERRSSASYHPTTPRDRWRIICQERIIIMASGFIGPVAIQISSCDCFGGGSDV